MNGEIVIQQYISSQFTKFRETDQFIDCVLETKDGDNIKCHRTILARYSQWFYLFFQENPQHQPIQIIKLPLNPDNVMSQIIDFFYKGHIHFTVNSIVSILHCADFYGMKILESIATNQFIEAQCEKTALFFAKKLIECNLTSKYIHLAPIISSQIKKIINNEPATLSKDDIFESLNPRLFHEVLMREDIFSMDDFVKAKIIDEFVGDNTELPEVDKQFLASAIDWAHNDSYKILVNFKCNWVPANISRPLYIYVLEVRKRNLSVLDEQIKNCQEFVGRWFLFPWLHSIKYSDLVKTNPQIEIVDFISKLGFMYKKIDSTAYGLFSTDSSIPISLDFQSKYAFSDGNYFLSALQSELPYITIDFGVHSRISADKIKIRCHATTEKDTEKPPPSPLSVIGKADGNEMMIANSINYEDLEMQDDYRTLNTSSKTPFQEITIAQEMPAQFGYNVLRVFNIEISGQFLP